MKVQSALVLGIIFLSVFVGCKNNETVTAAPSLRFTYGGIANFNLANINFDSTITDTVEFQVNLGTFVTIGEDVPVTIAVTDSSRSNYNATSGLIYEQMPATAYSLVSNTAVIPARSISANLTIIFYKNQIDSLKDYMLPITIANAGGYNINTTYSTIYFHYIGLQIVGVYNVEGTRLDYNGLTDDNDIDTIFNLQSEKEVDFIDSVSFYTEYANLGVLGWKYLIKFDSTVSGGIAVEPNNIMEAAINPGSFIIYASEYKPDSGKIYLKTGYTNTNLDDRVVEETFWKEW